MDKRNVKKREVWSSGQRRDLAPSDAEDSDGANLLLIFIGIHIKVEGMFAWEPWAENGTQTPYSVAFLSIGQSIRPDSEKAKLLIKF